jgi:hypothetical protein
MQNSLVHTSKHVYTIHVLCTRSLCKIALIDDLPLLGILPSPSSYGTSLKSLELHTSSESTQVLLVVHPWQGCITLPSLLGIPCTYSVLYLYFVRCGPISYIACLFFLTASPLLSVDSCCVQSSVLCVHRALYT